MYIHIVKSKVHVSTIFTTFIFFYDISKRKNEIKGFFFVEKFGYAWDTHAEVPHAYPKSASTQKVFGTSTAPFLEYPCFIGIDGGWARPLCMDGLGIILVFHFYLFLDLLVFFPLLMLNEVTCGQLWPLFFF